MGKLAMLAGLVMVNLPEYLVEIIYGKGREKRHGQLIDAKALAVGKLANTVRIPGVLPSVAESRQATLSTSKMLDKPGPSLARIEDLMIGGADGQIPARLYSSTTDTGDVKPAIVYYHGGGFIQGDLETHNELCKKLAKWSGGIVLAVDYRLAPEHPFPRGVDDAIAAFGWTHENAGQLGIDDNRIGVGGDSAGACLAAVVAQQTLKSKKPSPTFQVLIYPITDANLDTPSLIELEFAYILPMNRLLWYRDLYVGDFDDFDDPKISPLLATDFSGLPPAFVITGGFDPLCDDGKFYVEKLEAANVPVTHRNFPGQIHAFANLTKAIPQGTSALAEAAQWMSENW